ncbi:MAG: indolepyruvate oxidoreductase subunit beta [Oscillospiraceae bacterium]|nr:indolepyruvate oxidoreductase subunit beta [Oscillospiraceae bacterium]
MNNVKNILIVGVGGQGTLLASKLIGEVLVNAGYDVKVSEVHGMSQRGGSVVTYVRYGDAVASPLIDAGEADIILAFEALEAARYLPYLKKGGLIITADQRIDPMPVITGAMAYPGDLIGRLKAQDIRLVACDALSAANKAGNARAVNVVLIGILAKYMDFPAEAWEDAITAVVPERFRDVNLKAFALADTVAD